VRGKGITFWIFLEKQKGTGESFNKIDNKRIDPSMFVVGCS
jgi:hypothetical protein